MSRQADIKKLIITYNRRLQKLKEQQALEGRSTDPKVLIEIENIEAEIERLQMELMRLEADPPKSFPEERVIRQIVYGIHALHLAQQMSTPLQKKDDEACGYRRGYEDALNVVLLLVGGSSEIKSHDTIIGTPNIDNRPMCGSTDLSPG